MYPAIADPIPIVPVATPAPAKECSTPIADDDPNCALWKSKN